MRGGESESDVRKPGRARQLERAAPGSLPEDRVDWQWARQGRERLQVLLRRRAHEHGLGRWDLQPLRCGREKVCVAQVLLRAPSFRWYHCSSVVSAQLVDAPRSARSSRMLSCDHFGCIDVLRSSRCEQQKKLQSGALKTSVQCAPAAPSSHGGKPAAKKRKVIAPVPAWPDEAAGSRDLSPSISPLVTPRGELCFSVAADVLAGSDKLTARTQDGYQETNCCLQNLQKGWQGESS